MNKELGVGEKISIIIIILGVILGLFIFWIMPHLTQEQMYRYGGAEIHPEVEAYFYVECPLEHHRDHLHYIDTVENKVVHSHVEGIRLDITHFWYCDLHNIVFYVR